MYNLIEANHLIRRYNFSSLISRQDDLDTCEVVNDIIKQGNYFTNSPKYQTKENLFGRSEVIWLKYRMSFLFSVFLYLEKEYKVRNMMAWSFMTNLEGAEDREKLWHHHWHPSTPDAKMISGIWYLDIPKDVKDIDYCGTEFAPQGIDNDNKFFISPEYGQWIIYPSNVWHRPGIVQSNQYRYVLAADVEYY